MLSQAPKPTRCYRWRDALPLHSTAQLRASLAGRALRPSAPASSKRDVQELLKLVSGTSRGLESDAALTQRILEAVDRIATASSSAATTGPQLSSTWRLLWTTEKAGSMRTRAIRDL